MIDRHFLGERQGGARAAYALRARAASIPAQPYGEKVRQVWLVGRRLQNVMSHGHLPHTHVSPCSMPAPSLHTLPHPSLSTPTTSPTCLASSTL